MEEPSQLESQQILCSRLQSHAFTDVVLETSFIGYPRVVPRLVVHSWILGFPELSFLYRMLKPKDARNCRSPLHRPLDRGALISQSFIRDGKVNRYIPLVKAYSPRNCSIDGTLRCKPRESPAFYSPWWPRLQVDCWHSPLLLGNLRFHVGLGFDRDLANPTSVSIC